MEAAKPCCLVAERDPGTGNLLRGEVEAAGYVCAGPFVSCDEALSDLDQHEVQAAILDATPGDGSSLRLAETLRQRGATFLIYSDQPRGPETPAAFAGVPWLERPQCLEDLRQALRHLSTLVPA